MGALFIFAMGLLIGFCAAALVLAPCMLSSMISREEEKEGGDE